MANGPEGLLPALTAAGWDSIDWRRHEEEVRRLRSRIFKAVREGDWPKVRNLQKLMLRSWSNTLVSVRQVTQRNAGRKTAGIDGEVALTSQARAELAVRVHRTCSSWQPRAVKRVHIPKAGDTKKLRPLGIPVITDRCHQARVRNALEPEWEARFEPRSYGFRPGRSCHDAIEASYSTVSRRNARRVWILDADLAGAFDNIDHDHLLKTIGGFPARGMIAGWLQAGVFEAGKGFAPTEEGTPQGGVISPLLLNVALHGLEEAAGVRYHTGARAGETVAGSPVLIRYADDLVACCHSRQQATQVKARLAGWLAPRGLAFNEDKTSIVHLTEGFDYLGFNVRRYPNGKLLIKPSAPAVRRLKRRLAAELRALRGSNVTAVLAKLVPIMRGWAAYYRTVVSSKVFRSLDHYCGSSSTSGPSTATGTRRGPGSSTGTSPRSTSSGTTGGCSATVTAAPTCPGSPGLPSSGTPWSRAGRPRMTPPWPGTGPHGGARSPLRWTPTRCACSPGRTRAVRSAGTTCSPPTSHPNPLSSGNDGGCRSPGGR